MNAILKIEKALKSINQASFERLIISLLHSKYKFIGAPGSVIGKDKTRKGTPDSFFENEDKYVFVECTTLEKVGNTKSFLKKLFEDIEHCFNESATKVKKERIERIILACNERVSIKEYEQLHNKIKSYNSATSFEFYNIQNLPQLIFDIPKLAEEYLNIQIVKGNIYTLEQFLLKTKNHLHPSLTNEFIGREEELKNSYEILNKHNILLLTGGAGVGKSKLAVEILNEFSNNNYVPYVIQSSEVPLYVDWHLLFLPNKQYIILFDDANQSINNLEYLLSKLEEDQSYSIKIIITSRDYVKEELKEKLNNYSYKEMIIPKLKNEEIEKIIVTIIPNLQHQIEIKRKILNLAKGNARIALMAISSISSDTEINYLENTVLLYDKYFEKISTESKILKNPLFLKSLAIVSFFDFIDRNNENLKNILFSKFKVDWDELWDIIIELHNNEFLELHNNEIVRISDQVLALYAFYKCFIDEKTAVINYGEWILAFCENFSNRIQFTLIDINNSFDHYLIKELVSPHLNNVLEQIKSDEELYNFYSIFWFYKDRDCLSYLEKWIENLPQEECPEILKFNYKPNHYSKASKYFNLLKNFWDYSNELFAPSINLALNLLDKQPSRLFEILKFIDDSLKYKLEDFESNYERQNLLLDVLIGQNNNDIQNRFKNGIFLRLAKTLLGWHYNQLGSYQENTITIHNFDLYKSNELMELRKRILYQVYNLFDFENEQIQDILNQIIYPGGNIDKSIYIDELPFYQKLILNKLDNKQYAHCKFVITLAKHIKDAGGCYTEDWGKFIESDIIKTSNILHKEYDFRNNKSNETYEERKRNDIETYVKTNDWKTLEKFLLDISSLYKQQNNKDWLIQLSITDIYIYIAKKSKFELEKALRLFFGEKVFYPLQATFINTVFNENILTGKEFLAILNNYNFKERPYWESVIVALLPKEQVDKDFLQLLISTFLSYDNKIYIQQIQDYFKYQKEFENFQKELVGLENHNIITYLTSIIIERSYQTILNYSISLWNGSSSFFTQHLDLLKKAYWFQHKNVSFFDNKDEELKAILDLDRNFINESLMGDKIGLNYSYNIKLKDINTEILWRYDEYEELIENLLITIIDKKHNSFVDMDNVYSLFNIKNNNENDINKIKQFIIKLTNKHCNNEEILLLFIEVVYNTLRNWFIDYFKHLLIKNKDISLMNKIKFEQSKVYVNSRIPYIKKEIEFFQEILSMIKTFPNILDYSQHLDFFEKKIVWKKNEIKEQQKIDFYNKLK